jgi:hypothetical protein
MSEPTLDFYCWPAGDADCLVLHTPGGAWGVIDCGLVTPNPALRNPEKIWSTTQDLKDFLRGRQISRLDFVVMTHPEADRAKGLLTLLSEFEFGVFGTTVGALRRAALKPLRELVTSRTASGRGDELVIIEAGQELWQEAEHAFRLVALGPGKRDLQTFATVTQRLLKPTSSAGKSQVSSQPQSQTSPELLTQVDEMVERLETEAEATLKGRPPYNRLSIILLGLYSGGRLLLGVDALATSWRELAKKLDRFGEGLEPADFRVQVFKVPHHGANDALPLELAPLFLSEGARTVISSSGHSFASPSREMLAGLTGLGSPPYCTGRSAWCPGRFVGRPCCGLVKIQLFRDGRPPLVEMEQPWREKQPVMCDFEAIKAQAQSK